MRKEKILFVDDDTNLLDSFKRVLRGEFEVDTAPGPVTGLQKLNKSGPYAVVVADMKMPEMSGIEFLKRVRELFPDTVRIVLTGHGDLQVSIEAINRGRIFRFLTKPCGKEDMLRALEDGVAQYRLIKGEKELLEKTLTGTVQVLMEILSLTNEEAMGRAARIKRFVRDVAIHMGEMDIWLYESAAMLSQIGCITLPESVLKKVGSGEKLEPEEMQLYNQHPFIAADILCKIPRMQEVARIISYQEKYFNGGGLPVDRVKGMDIPLGARILKLVLDFNLYTNRGLSRKKALFKMADKKERYDPQVYKALVEVLRAEDRYQVRSVQLSEIVPFMVIMEDVYSLNGAKLLTAGHEVSETIAEKLRRMDETYGVKQPIQILIPPQKILEEKRKKLEEGQG
ncbi:MAG: HD domain-containing phosphohydrolase [Desulfonatronovibrionaceae bacterium]